MKIAIDGPAGAGKSTIAKAIAKELGFIYVDTGAMFRALAIRTLDRGAAADDEETVAAALRDAVVDIDYPDGTMHVYLDGEDVTGSLRTEEVGNTASAISVHPKVRDIVLALERKIADAHSVVMDGRDIGTVVLPDAECKIYLTASVETRAMRRYLELKEKGEAADLDAIAKDIKERDERDMNRPVAPLKQAEDAYYLDSSEKSIEEVLAEIRAQVDACR